MEVGLSLPDDEQERLKKILFPHLQLDDCADWAWDLPVINCSIKDKYINKTAGIISWYKWQITKNIFLGGRTRSVTFDPNWAKVIFDLLY